jgi:hypothetical protein
MLLLLMMGMLFDKQTYPSKENNKSGGTLNNKNKNKNIIKKKWKTKKNKNNKNINKNTKKHLRVNIKHYTRKM